MPLPGTSPFSLRRGRTPATATALPPASAASISNAPQYTARKHPDVILLMESAPRSGLFIDAAPFDWVSVTRAMDGGDTTCEIQAGLDANKLGAAGTLGTEHFAHLMQRITPDRRVRVEQGFGASKEVLFQGFPMMPSVSYVETDQVVRATCLNEGQELLQNSPFGQITGRYRWHDALAMDTETLVRSQAPVFNPNGRPNRHPTPAITTGPTVFLFADDGAPGAQLWNYGQALAYLAWYYIVNDPLSSVSADDLLADTQQFVDAGPQNSDDAYVERMSATCRHLSVASVDVERAIYMVCDAAGLHYEITHRTNGEQVDHYVRVMAAIDQPSNSFPLFVESPVVHDLPREAPFGDLSARTTGDAAVANRAVQADLTIDHRAASFVGFLGAPEVFEVALLLRPGWLPVANLDNATGASDLSTEVARLDAKKYWEGEFVPPLEDDGSGKPRSVYHTDHPDHDTVRDVGRLWVFPDDVTYTNANGTSQYERIDWAPPLYSPFAEDGSNVLADQLLGAGLASAGQWVPRVRPLGNLLERSDPSVDRAPRVYFNFQAAFPDTALSTPGWVEYRGDRVIDSQRAAILITAPDLWNDPALNTNPTFPNAGVRMLEAYLGLGFVTTPETGEKKFGMVPAPHFFVAVRCTITGDDRMLISKRNRQWQFRRNRIKIQDLGPIRFQKNTLAIIPGSLETTESTDEKVVERDDTYELNLYAERQARLVGGSVVSGSVDVPWIDYTYRIGDSFSGAGGLGVGFATYPEIVRIVYTKGSGAGYRTQLHLTDLRSAPDVDIT